NINRTTAYNNLIHDNNAGVNIFVKYEGAQVYNNVMWNNVNNFPIRLCTYSGDNSSDVGYIYNNTVDLTGGTTTFVGQQPGGTGLGTINIRNNHLIGATAVSSVLMATQIVTNNPQMNSAQATSQGYTAANKYAPTLVTNGTV